MPYTSPRRNRLWMRSSTPRTISILRYSSTANCSPIPPLPSVGQSDNAIRLRTPSGSSRRRCRAPPLPPARRMMSSRDSIASRRTRAVVDAEQLAVALHDLAVDEDRVDEARVGVVDELRRSGCSAASCRTCRCGRGSRRRACRASRLPTLLSRPHARAPSIVANSSTSRQVSSISVDRRPCPRRAPPRCRSRAAVPIVARIVPNRWPPFEQHTSIERLGRMPASSRRPVAGQPWPICSSMSGEIEALTP